MNKLELQKKANEVRKGIVTAVHAAKAGHPGGSLSAADIFTYLYFEELNIDPKDPKKADRDRFVLSKGHTAPGLYSALALRAAIPPAAPSVPHSPPRWAWHDLRSYQMSIIVFTRFSEMVRSRKDRSGRLLCSLDSVSLIISL